MFTTTNSGSRLVWTYLCIDSNIYLGSHQYFAATGVGYSQCCHRSTLRIPGGRYLSGVHWAFRSRVKARYQFHSPTASLTALTRACECGRKRVPSSRWFEAMTIGFFQSIWWQKEKETELWQPRGAAPQCSQTDWGGFVSRDPTGRPQVPLAGDLRGRPHAEPQWRPHRRRHQCPALAQACPWHCPGVWPVRVRQGSEDWTKDRRLLRLPPWLPQINLPGTVSIQPKRYIL